MHVLDVAGQAFSIKTYIVCRMSSSSSQNMCAKARLVGTGLGGVELAVQVAGKLQEAALGAGHPQVGAAGVKHDAEELRRSAQTNLTIVCAPHMT